MGNWINKFKDEIYVKKMGMFVFEILFEVLNKTMG